MKPGFILSIMGPEHLFFIHWVRLAWGNEMFCYSVNMESIMKSVEKEKYGWMNLPFHIPKQQKQINFFKNQRLDERNKGEITVQNMRICIWWEKGDGPGHQKKGK